MYKNSKKDNLPVDFERYYEKFVHVITRTIKGGRYKTSGKIREFREERANRVHWIRPILENKEDKRITYFQYIEDDGTLRDYYWYRGKQYIVIVEYIQPDYALITGFCVDCDNQPYYQNKYINRENKGIKNRIYGNAGNQVLRSSSDDTANIDIPFVLNKGLSIYKE